MVTDKQMEANKLNALKSTGPKTVEGKAKVSINAIKHGLMAQAALIKGEDQDLFDEFSNHIYTVYSPVGDDETFLVEQLISYHWRLRRITQIEVFLLDPSDDLISFGGKVEPISKKMGRRFNFCQRAFAQLSRYEISLFRMLVKCQFELQQLKLRKKSSVFIEDQIIDATGKE